jgi:hypothetical protein
MYSAFGAETLSQTWYFCEHLLLLNRFMCVPGMTVRLLMIHRCPKIFEFSVTLSEKEQVR